MLTVFQAGEDRLLLETRRRVLESLGLKVMTAGSAREALEQIPGLHFDIAILCHSVSVHRRQELAAALRMANPAAPILLVGRGFAGLVEAESVEIDAIIDPHPARLTESLARLLHLKRRSGIARYDEGLLDSAE